jgi:hypothetical protein
MKFRSVNFAPHDNVRFFAFTNEKPYLGLHLPLWPSDIGHLTWTLSLVVVSFQVQLWFK